MCVGNMQILCHFIQGTWASADFGICRGSWNQSPVDTKGQFYNKPHWFIHSVCSGKSLWIPRDNSTISPTDLFIVYALVSFDIYTYTHEIITTIKDSEYVHHSFKNASCPSVVPLPASFSCLQATTNLFSLTT